jgi:hypothetical protein
MWKIDATALRMTVTTAATLEDMKGTTAFTATSTMVSASVQFVFEMFMVF